MIERRHIVDPDEYLRIKMAQADKRHKKFLVGVVLRFVALFVLILIWLWLA